MERKNESPQECSHVRQGVRNFGGCAGYRNELLKRVLKVIDLKL